MKTPAVILALVFAFNIGYLYGRPHVDTQAEKDAIHAHNVTACGVEWLPGDYTESTTVNDINRHDNPIYNCRMAVGERYFGVPEGSWGRLPVDPPNDHAR
jgi:hypothetical protein